MYVKYFLQKIQFCKLFLSNPFKTPKLKFYLGKIKHGVPYFLPRKWIKYNKQDILKALYKDLNNKHHIYYNKWDEVEELFKHYINYKKAVPIKIFNFQFIGLGWKTKWNDFRFEWSPQISIIFMGLQFCIWVKPKYEMHYWECWLNYEKLTDKTKSVKERLKQAQEIYPCIWKSDKEITNYWRLILKNKYINEIQT